jgi:hypothetical protein
MTRTLLLIPATLVLTAAGGAALCAVAGWQPHPREMAFALVAMTVASAAGALPILLARHATQAGVSQAGLIGTMAHVMVGAAGVAAVVFGRLPLNNAFVHWSMALYATSLAALVVVINRAIKAAPPAPSSATHHKA